MAIWPTGLDAAFALLPFFVANVPVDVVIDVPTEAASVTTQLIDVQWSFSPGAQSSYRVRFWSDASASVLIHDSGVVGSASAAVTFDGMLIGLENATTYYITVDLTLTNSGTGVSGIRSFTLAAAPTNDVTGMTATPINSALPHNLVAWTAFTLGGGETFINYNVFRRVAAVGGVWTRIAGPALTNRTGNVSYLDYNAASFIIYDYTVTARVTTSTGEEESDKPAADTAIMAFIESYIHDEADDTFFTEMKLLRTSFPELQDQGLVAPWGRQKPTVFVGDQQSRKGQVMATNRAWSTERSLFDDLHTLLDRQRENSSVLVLRWERDIMFCQINKLTRTNQVGDAYTMVMDVQEVFIDESDL